MNNPIVKEDLEYIHQQSSSLEKFKGTTILITGCAGFLGFYFLQFLLAYKESLQFKKIIGIDNFKLRNPQWLKDLHRKHQDIFDLYPFNIINDDFIDIQGLSDVQYVIHMASIASPTFYRKFPIDTIDANVWGLRRLLDYFYNKKIKGLLFFSSSEVYGNPETAFVPTNEEYLGNVVTIGPRACYDEAKRFGETLCYVFADQYGMPISIVRPFNNFGPGMDLQDQRVPADFAKAVFMNQDIHILSDGTPKRTFCYITDAIVGYIKCLLYGKFEYFNIGMDAPEISIKEFADLYQNKGKQIFGYTGQVLYNQSEEQAYLIHNPQRRCPNIEKAKVLLNYLPSISVEQGVEKYLSFIKMTEGKL